MEQIIKIIYLIDQIVTQQTLEIMQNDRLKKLIGSWIGIYYLVHCFTTKKIKIKIYHVTWEELSKDLRNISEIEQSPLFEQIYFKEFDMPGSEPFGILLGDYNLRIDSGKHKNDLEILQLISEIAKTSFVPFVTSINPKSFGVESFLDLSQVQDFDIIFQEKKYMDWNKLRSMPSSKFICLVIPEVLIVWNFIDRMINSHLLGNKIALDIWSNACYAYGALIIKSFEQTGWFAKSFGSVNTLRLNFNENSRYMQMDCLSEAMLLNVRISEKLENILANLGFVCLCETPFRRELVIYSQPTIFNDHAEKDQRVLMYLILCACRFSHYIKAIMRDKIGSYITADGCEKYIENWLWNYIANNSGLTEELRLRYPLQDAKVVIKEYIIDSHYLCSIYLKPHVKSDIAQNFIVLKTSIKHKTNNYNQLIFKKAAV